MKGGAPSSAVTSKIFPCGIEQIIAFFPETVPRPYMSERSARHMSNQAGDCLLREASVPNSKNSSLTITY